MVYVEVAPPTPAAGAAGATVVPLQPQSYAPTQIVYGQGPPPTQPASQPTVVATQVTQAAIQQHTVPVPNGQQV